MLKNIVIVDIDGTISKVGDRLKYLKQKPVDWDSFYEACSDDEPIENIINLVKSLELQGYRIVYCTGRKESVREKTKEWIGQCMYVNQLVVPFDADLLMRPNGDYRYDTIVKPEQLGKAGVSLDDIAFVLEDRNSMVKKWRELGLTCLQVADGDF